MTRSSRWRRAWPRHGRCEAPSSWSSTGWGTTFHAPSGRRSSTASARPPRGRGGRGRCARAPSNSMGGLVAMMEAALAPERVAGLVLVAPAQPRSAEARMDGRVAALFLYALPVLGELALRWRARLLGPEGQVRSTLALCCADASRVAPEVVAAHVALARERLERMPWASRAFMEAARSLIALLARRSWFDQMVQRITAPTLLVQGDRDRLVAPAASRRLADLRPDWSFELFADVGHVPQLEEPARFVGSVERWLAERAPAAASR